MTITYSWAPKAYVGITINGVPSGPVSTAIANWNAGLSGWHCSPVLFQGYIGTDPTITMNYVPILPPSNCQTCVTRGLTYLNTATITNGRLYNVQMDINTVVTATAALTEVIAHEFGHIFALADCDYPGCPIGSSVMEANAPLSSVNSTIGQPGPTPCDITAVGSVATDYACPPPPPPPPPECVCPEGCPACVLVVVAVDGTIKPDNASGCCLGGTPILIDTGGKGFSLTDAKNGVWFDISGSGRPIEMGWTAEGADNAFLALPGPDGLVHDGKQLFGMYTPQPPSANPNGFAALAVYDDPRNGGNSNGEIDPGDAIYSHLRLWIDANHDGICQPEELHTLASLGVTSISLHYHADKKTDQYGNQFRYRAEVDPNQTDPNHVGRSAYDVYFVSIQPLAKAGTIQKCPIPNPNVLKPAADTLSDKSSRLK